MNEIPINAVGRLVADPERTYRQDGVAVTLINVEVRQRRLTPDGWRTAGTVTLECRAWAALAEHIFDSLGAGDRVVITGRLRQRPISPGTLAFDVMLQDVGASLAFTNVQLINTDAEPSGVSEDSKADASSGASQAREVAAR